MATLNPFDLLGDDDTEDPSQLIAAQKVPVAATKKTPAPAAAQQEQSKPAAKLPLKPLPISGLTFRHGDRWEADRSRKAADWGLGLGLVMVNGLCSCYCLSCTICGEEGKFPEVMQAAQPVNVPDYHAIDRSSTKRTLQM